jgi:3',5'-cyclic AMP phosphodiesterase CpdA
VGILVTVLLAGGLAACDRSDPANDGPLTRIAVIGDFGTGHGDAEEVASALRAADADDPFDVLVTTGDNVYQAGAPADFFKWEQPYGWVQDEGIAVVASLGNHDARTDEGIHVEELLGMPASWYVERIGPVRFVVLDSNRVGDPDQQAFLTSTLDPQRDAPWTVVVFHHPAYSCGKHKSTPEVVADWEPLFADGGVDLVLNGHDHNYQRFEAVDGVTHVVTGGGGAPLYAVDRCPSGTPEPVASAVEHHFLSIEATAGSLRGTAITPSGEEIDGFALTR